MDDLDSLIDDLGGRPGVAARMGVTPQRLSNWLRRGNVPADQIIPLCRALHWRATPHQINPHVYPHPCDGIPIDACEEAPPA